ncbi:hypothetical protein H7R52_05750 [Weissella confusa]|uniref:D-isomer specific 2-hydroxyacid dehydrogenase catalytic domain-containing protein n=1 Tax=Weissella confusa TaxID=1583 RepID=A0A923NET6_WEICO|nr:hypothetical protein [Weissella confusa]
MFATELHNLTVGIIGTGRIGQAEAELWRGVGATVLGYDVYQKVLARANCALQADMLQKLSEHGIKYVFTRTVGHNHIDLHVAKEYGIIVAYVPSYSPYAVAELAFTLASTTFCILRYQEN